VTSESKMARFRGAVASLLGHATFRRWCDTLIYAAVAAFAFEVLLPLGIRLGNRIPILDAYAPWLLLLGCYGGIFLAAFIACEPIRIRSGHWRYVLRYPPLWFAVVLGVGLAIVGAVTPEWMRPLVGVPVWIDWYVMPPTLLAVAGAIALRQLPWAQKRRRRIVSNTPTAEWNWQGFEKWFGNEEPAEVDYFNHSPVSARMVQTLLDVSRDQSIALLGPFGSGKTTILERVRAELEDSDTPAVVIVDFNAWAIADAADAPRVALEKIVEGLGGIVDVQRFRALPKTYQKLISAEPSGMLAKLVGSETTGEPLAQLQQLEPILRALNVRVVMFVEDADRAGVGFDTRHLERLLATLREVKRLSFVLSLDGTKGPTFDYRKLCDVIELVPKLDPEDVFATLSFAYRHWISSVPYIDPRNGDKRKSRLNLDEPVGELLRYFRRTSGDTPAHALATLLGSPRRLKHLVRRVDRLWNSLRGEVDLDDVIVLAALRDLDDRSVFNFLAENIDPAREEPKGELDRTKSVKAAWKSLVERTPDGDSVQRLINVLGIEQLTTDRFGRSQDAVQGAHVAEPDYFRRILAEQMAPGEVRDQVVLSDMDSWKRDRGGPMFARLLAATEDAKTYVQMWEYFSDRITDEELLELADALIEATLSADGSAATMETQPALLAVWRRINRRIIRRPQSVDWLSGQIERAIPISLRMAVDLLYYYANDRSGILPDGGWVIVRRRMLDAARTAFISVETLLRAIVDGSVKQRYALLHFVRPPDHRDDLIDIRPEDRAWLAPLLIQAARQQPQQVIPNVLLMFGDNDTWFSLEQDEKRRLEKAYVLNREQMELIFGDHVIEMLEIIVEHEPQDDIERRAATLAAAWLAEIRMNLVNRLLSVLDELARSAPLRRGDGSA
jgi:KAP family P-loop domain